MPQEALPYTGKNKMNDGRRKLSDNDKSIIKALYESGLCIRHIALIYEKKCTRRCIQFTLFPERLHVLQKRVHEEKRWKRYYSTDKQKENIRKYRAKKRKLNLMIKRGN